MLTLTKAIHKFEYQAKYCTKMADKFRKEDKVLFQSQIEKYENYTVDNEMIAGWLKMLKGMTTPKAIWFSHKDEFICSNCKQKQKEMTRFCPYCGFRMNLKRKPKKWYQKILPKNMNDDE